MPVGIIIETWRWVKSVARAGGNVVDAFLGLTDGEFGAKKTQRDTALGQFGAGRASSADARTTKRSVAEQRKIR